MRLRHFIATLFLGSFSLPLHAQDSNLDAQGEAALKVQDFPGAMALFDRAIQENPQDARAWCDRAYTWTAMKELDKARLDCRSSLQADPHYAKAYGVLGNINWISGDTNDALNDFDQALSLDPNDATLWYNRGLYYFQRDSGKCVIDMTQAIRLARNYEDPYYIRGNVYLDQQHFDEAIQDYSEAIRIDPDRGNLYHQRGYAYQKSGKLDQAIADFTSAIRLKPQSDKEYFARGYAYAEAQAFDKAIADFTTAIQFNPKNGGYYLQRAQSYLMQGNKAQAQTDLQQASLLKRQD